MRHVVVPVEISEHPWTPIYREVYLRNFETALTLLKEEARRVAERSPDFLARVGGVPPRGKGRPKETYSTDETEALAVALAIDEYQVKKSQVLRLLGRENRTASDYKWLDRRLRHGQKLRRAPNGEVGELLRGLASRAAPHRVEGLSRLLEELVKRDAARR